MQPDGPADATSAGGTARIATFAEAYLASGLDSGSYKVGTQGFVQNTVAIGNYSEGGQYCKYGGSDLVIMGPNQPFCAFSQDWIPSFINPQTTSRLNRLSTSSLQIGDTAKNTATQIAGNVADNRTLTLPDGNSTTSLTGSLTTTAAGSDSVTIVGVTPQSHCTLTPTNAAAATNVLSTFISGKILNQVIVSHSAIASMDYDILCTAS
jgi:hypothetical protein